MTTSFDTHKAELILYLSLVDVTYDTVAVLYTGAVPIKKVLRHLFVAKNDRQLFQKNNRFIHKFINLFLFFVG